MLCVNPKSRYDAAMDTAYTIRELHGREVVAALDGLNEPIPFPELAMAKVAYDPDGSLVGYALFQLVPHVDGFWVRPDRRGNQLTTDLLDTISDVAQQATDYYLSLATSPFVDRLCERAGMKAMDGRLYRWVRQ